MKHTIGDGCTDDPTQQEGNTGGRSGRWKEIKMEKSVHLTFRRKCHTIISPCIDVFLFFSHE